MKSIDTRSGKNKSNIFPIAGLSQNSHRKCFARNSASLFAKFLNIHLRLDLEPSDYHLFLSIAIDFAGGEFASKEACENLLLDIILMCPMCQKWLKAIYP